MATPKRYNIPSPSTPRFENEARQHILGLTQFNTEELEKLLHISPKLATENYLRYHDFLSPEMPLAPALLSYTGIVFKRINPKDFTAEDFDYAQKHLFISSFLYGLLRPQDLIHPYRLEGNVHLPELNGSTLFDYWKPLLTSYFINEIKARNGILVNLASSEMKDLFWWKQVTETVRVITPEFQVYKNGRLSTVVVYAKMCRGEMTRFLLKNRINRPEDLCTFAWEGFTYNEVESTPERPVFTLE